MPGFASFALFANAAADDDITLTRKDGVFHVEARLSVAADVNTAWQVLTDYDHLADFVPGMKSSRVMSTEPLEIEQTGNTGFFVFNRDFDVIMDLTPMPPTRLEFNVVRGAKSMRGYWAVHQENAGPIEVIALVYIADIEPDFWVPPFIGTALMKRQLRQNVESVAAEIQRRYTQANAKQ